MTAINLKRTNSTDADFASLIHLLDIDLAISNGDEQAFFDQFNKVDMINHVIVAYVDGIPAGCGAFKRINDLSAEIKRMFVKAEMRGQGISSRILKELEIWAKQLFFTYTILETSKAQKDALILYHKKGYIVTENYEPYIGVDSSICFKKLL